MRNGFHQKIIVILLSLSIGWVQADSARVTEHCYGYIEPVLLLESNVHLLAKMDTGAKTASLSATDIVIFDSEGQQWVSFTINDKSRSQGVTQSRMTLPLKRYARIKPRKQSESSQLKDAIKRPVVSMTIQLGDTVQAIDVNLIDRRHFIYPMLLGREAIVQFNGVINPSQKKLTGTVVTSNKGIS